MRTGKYTTPPPDERPAAREHEAEAVVPVLAEEVVVEKRPVPTGGVRVNRHITEHDEIVEVPLVKEHVDVRRVVVDREVEGPLPVRREGDLTIIPVVEEVLVVQKRYVLKEEIHVTRRATEEVHRERVTVRRQEAEVEQVGADGVTRRVAPATSVTEPTVTSTEPAARPRRRRSILTDD